MPRETRVWEIFWETKPDLPTPEKKMVPREFRRVWVKVRVWERSRFWKKWLRYFCWDLKRVSRCVSSRLDFVSSCCSASIGMMGNVRGREPI